MDTPRPARTRRASPLPPDERRAALVQAAIDVTREQHALPTTRQIAQAAGVAEGTIFRSFASKDQLFDAVIERTFDPRPFRTALDAVVVGSLEETMTGVVTVLQGRFLEIFDVMGAFALSGPPERFVDPERQRRNEEETGEHILRLFEPHADRLRLPVSEVVRLMRLLTFGGSNKHINDGQVMTPEQITRAVLYGVVNPETD